jgi:hypothetical protein
MSGETQEAVVLVQFWDIDDTFIGQASGVAAAGQVDWSRVTDSFVVPDGTALIRVRAALRAPANAGGTVWFDDISLVPLGGS